MDGKNLIIILTKSVKYEASIASFQVYLDSLYVNMFNDNNEYL